jgi:hypothetical protein
MEVVSTVVYTIQAIWPMSKANGSMVPFDFILSVG